MLRNTGDSILRSASRPWNRLGLNYTEDLADVIASYRGSLPSVCWRYSADPLSKPWLERCVTVTADNCMSRDVCSRIVGATEWHVSRRLQLMIYRHTSAQWRATRSIRSAVSWQHWHMSVTLPDGVCISASIAYMYMYVTCQKIQRLGLPSRGVRVYPYPRVWVGYG